MLHLAGIKNCNKIRDTKKWLEERDIAYEFIDLKKEPLSRHELQDLKEKVGLDVLINKRGRTWRNLGLKDSNPSEKELFEALLENQTMIKRPVLIQEHAVLVGYDEDSFESFIGEYDKSE
ncbi:MAG: Spx/MgsR family RNA polymerase-binding regulatory protein [Balneolaceae bacterium]|nr:Spx/MgsR family RNA polymerase-binding regulatory protein [Balneolaceae bacterium]